MYILNVQHGNMCSLYFAFFGLGILALFSVSCVSLGSSHMMVSEVVAKSSKGNETNDFTQQRSEITRTKEWMSGDSEIHRWRKAANGSCSSPFKRLSDIAPHQKTLNNNHVVKYYLFRSFSRQQNDFVFDKKFLVAKEKALSNGFYHKAYFVDDDLVGHEFFEFGDLSRVTIKKMLSKSKYVMMSFSPGGLREQDWEYKDFYENGVRILGESNASGPWSVLKVNIVAQDKVVLFKFVDDKQNVLQTITFNWLRQPLKIERNVMFRSPNLPWKIEYRYDDHKIIEKKEQFVGNKFLETKYRWDGGFLNSYSTKNEKGFKIFEMLFDEQGRSLKSHRYSLFSGKKLATIYFSYDQKHRMVVHYDEMQRKKTYLAKIDLKTKKLFRTIQFGVDEEPVSETLFVRKNNCVLNRKIRFHFGADNVVQRKKMWHFDDQGSPVKTELFKNNVLIAYQRHVRGDDGVLLARHEYDANKKPLGSIWYEHDDFGLVRVKTLIEKGKTKNVFAYDYDAQGNLRKQKVFNGKEELEEVSIFDDLGRIVETELGRNNVLYKKIRNIYNDVGLLNKQLHYDRLGLVVKRFLFTHDDEGRKKQADVYTGTKQYLGSVRWIRDALGVLIRKEWYGPEKKLIKKETSSSEVSSGKRKTVFKLLND